jgi:hypothetical protein
VVAGHMMALGGTSGGEAVGPYVGLCVVASGSQHSGSGSYVGPAGNAVLDGESPEGWRVSPTKKKMVWLRHLALLP